jgi:hypothetical protein
MNNTELHQYLTGKLKEYPNNFHLQMTDLYLSAESTKEEDLKEVKKELEEIENDK